MFKICLRKRKKCVQTMAIMAHAGGAAKSPQIKKREWKSITDTVLPDQKQKNT